MSENTVNRALRLMGYDTKTDVCGHGFRTMACSALVESELWSGYRGAADEPSSATAFGRRISTGLNISTPVQP